MDVQKVGFMKTYGELTLNEIAKMDCGDMPINLCDTLDCSTCKSIHNEKFLKKEVEDK